MRCRSKGGQRLPEKQPTITATITCSVHPRYASATFLKHVHVTRNFELGWYNEQLRGH